MTRRLYLVLAILFAPIRLSAGEPREWTIDGVKREAIVVAPDDAKTKPSPLVFAFHGHGGKMADFSRKLQIYRDWPEAIVVYPQGVNTPGRLTDHEGKFPGWQAAPGEHGDRDLKFFDAMIESLEHDYKVDVNRVYSTGHSNGGTFTYVLWQARADKIAAFAPIASALSMTAAATVQSGDPNEKAAPKVHRPVMHVAGENDPLVKIEWQRRTIDFLRKFNDCGEGKPWEGKCTLYPSKSGDADVIGYVHPGKHNMPADASAMIVKFFKDRPLPARTTPSSHAQPNR